MALRLAVRTAAVLGGLSCGLAATADDSQVLVQKAIELRPTPHHKETRVVQASKQTRLMERPMKEKQTPEERKAEPVTRQRVHELISGGLKKIPHFPTLLTGTIEQYVVPKVMEARRQTTSARRRLMDSFVVVDWFEGNISTLLESAAQAFKVAGQDIVGEGLENATILLPLALQTTSKILQRAAVMMRNFTGEAQPALSEFMQESMPSIRELLGKELDIIEKDIMPIMDELEPELETAFVDAMKGVADAWNADPDFTALTTDALGLLGNLTGENMTGVFSKAFDSFKEIKLMESLHKLLDRHGHNRTAVNSTNSSDAGASEATDVELKQ